MDLLFPSLILVLLVMLISEKRRRHELKREFDDRIELYRNMVSRRDERISTLGAAVNDLRSNGKAKKSRYYEEALQDVELLIKVDHELHVRS